MSTVIAGLPALCAVVLGVCTYVGYLPVWYGAAAVVVGIVALVLGRLSLGYYPVVGALLISLWILTGVGLMAGSAWALLWLGLHASQLFPNVDAVTLKEAAAAVTGAVTTFVGVVITKDMEEGRGHFWPSAQFRLGAERSFGSGPRAPVGDSKEWDAVYEDRVCDNGPIGWGFRSRLRRAQILKQHLKRRAV